MQTILIQQMQIVQNIKLKQPNVLLIVLIMDVLIGLIHVPKCFQKPNVILVYRILLFVYGVPIHVIKSTA